MPHNKQISGVKLPSLEGYSLASAIRMAVAVSDKNEDEIAAAMGWGSSVSNRVFSNQDYWPTLPTIPRFCEVTGNTILAQWIVDNTNFLAVPAQPMDAPTLMADLRKMMREFSELLRESEKALEDGSISTAEARRVLNELDDIFSVGSAMTSRLQAVIQRKKGE